MDCKDLKKLLAGLGVAGLISAGGVTLPGAHAAGSSGWGATHSAGSAEKAMDKAAGSGAGTDPAVTTGVEKAESATPLTEEELKKKAEEEAAKAKAEAAKGVEKPAGSSGWSGSK